MTKQIFPLAAAAILIVLTAESSWSQSFAIRLVHPDNAAIVGHQKTDADLSNYEKHVWKRSRKNEDLWVSKKIEISVKDLKQACLMLGLPNEIEYKKLEEGCLKRRLPQPGDIPLENSEPTIFILLTPEGSRKFADVTGRNVRGTMAVFLNQKVLTPALIHEPVNNGVFAISGYLNKEEAENSVRRINELIKQTRR